ncbi:MAG: hypothetical protein KDI71_19290, partial [Xanthomonadales bacterium]|nr:hypothetical protein [Xanthomonadales bacterium]
VSVTLVLAGKSNEQVLPQLMPLGLLVIVPLPVPALLTDKAKVDGGVTLNVAVTLRAWLMTTKQVPVPEQAPPQPAKVDPVTAEAVSVT